MSEPSRTGSDAAPAQVSPGSTGSRPSVSVIMAAYDCASFIDGAIDSVLAQTRADWELFVVDDASTDGTIERARARAVADPRIRVLSMAGNQGPSAARNAGIAAARGEWIAVLDGDDWWEAERLDRLLEAAARFAADVVFDDMHLVESETGQTFSTRFRDVGFAIERPTPVSASTIAEFDLGSVKPLMRRAFLDAHGLRYQTGLHYGEDFLLLVQCALAGTTMIALPQAYYCLRRGNTGSLTTNRIELTRRLLESTRAMTTLPAASAAPGLCALLERRARRLERLQLSYEVTVPLRQGRLGAAIAAVLQRPRRLLAAMSRLPEVLTTRARRAMGGGR